MSDENRASPARGAMTQRLQRGAGSAGTSVGSHADGCDGRRAESVVSEPATCHTRGVSTSNQSLLGSRLRAMFPAGGRLLGSSRGTVLETRFVRNEFVLVVSWPTDARIYGIPIPLTDTRRDFYYRSRLADDDEWLDSVGLGLMVMLDTGFRWRARRTMVDNYIELRADGGWPSDDRFYMQFERASSRNLHGLADHLRADGLDPAAAMTAATNGRLLEWVLAYENNATGSPWVGQAVAVRRERGPTVDLTIETVSGTPRFLDLDLAYFGAHAAADHGAAAVLLTEGESLFEIAGFRSIDGGMVLDTGFLESNPAESAAFLTSDTSGDPRWRRNGDGGGRASS